MQDLSGKDIGRYHIVDRLGHGGMATVYKAYDSHLEREVAIKFIRKEEFAETLRENMLKRFEREGKSLARMMHPNIVPVYDYGEYEGMPYLVMAYVSGGTLKVLTGVPMPFTAAARLLAPIARALAYAHENKVVHRDVKPANILLTSKGEPMLSDFGIAKILETGEGNTLTGTGVGIGTPEYMAPEQGMGSEADYRSDIYSLGVMLFELVTGKKPFTAETPMAVIIKHVTTPLPSPLQFIPNLPEEAEQVICKALAKKPEERFASMAEFATALERLIRLEDIETRAFTLPVFPAEQGGESQEADLSAIEPYSKNEITAHKIEEATRVHVSPAAPVPARLEDKDLPTVTMEPVPGWNKPESGDEEPTQMRPPQELDKNEITGPAAEPGTILEKTTPLEETGHIELPPPIETVLTERSNRVDEGVAQKISSRVAETSPSIPIRAVEAAIPEKPSRPRWVWIGLGGVVLLALLGVGIVLSNQWAKSSQATATRTIAVVSIETQTVQVTETSLAALTDKTEQSQITSTSVSILTPTPPVEEIKTRIWKKTGMEQVYIPAGEFKMGSVDGDPDERPVHTVYLDAYWIDKTEVTNAQFALCAAAKKCTFPTNTSTAKRDSYYRDPQYANYPVMFVSWNQAKSYCLWAGMRLPSEAEWEKAARGTDGRTYPWGNEPAGWDFLNYNRNNDDTSAGGDYPAGASPYGVMDLAGNLWEWVGDWYAQDYYETSPGENPLGPGGGQLRVLRGGSFFEDGNQVRSANREFHDPEYAWNTIGFRCASAE